MELVRSRRLTLLTCVVVALNLALWLVPQGLALGTALITRVVGPKLVRAEVIESTGARPPTGVSTAASSSSTSAAS